MLVLAISDTTKTLVVAIVGIGVSGFVGPAATAWATRRANRQQFERDQKAKRRDDFRDLVDDAAKLLGAGVTNLRRSRDAKSAGEDDPPDVNEWATQVHLLKQRLLLRRGSDTPVMTSYEEVLEALAAVGSADAEPEYDAAVATYEQCMEAFLATARAAISAPVG
jgi:hypothetical protein